MKYTLDEIKEAYRKLKNYIYYEDNEVDLKIKIAEFEMREKFEKELEIIVNEVNNYSTEEDKNYINSLIKKIGYKVYPKKIENDDIENSKEGIITNKTTHLNKIKIEEVKYIIDMPIELHIISVLWIMKLGVLIDVEISENAYGNRLSKNIEKKQTTFKPYFKKYKEWRNKAIEKAEELLNNNINISLISLDIKNFYHSINFKRSIIENNINIIESIEHSNLIDVIENICIFYTGLFKEKSKTYILPIGLLPSMILSNLYLKEFDNLLIENIECEYYGRYVDDILILFKEENNIKYSNITDFINKKLLKTGILNIKNGEEKIFEITSNPELLIQSGKSKLYLFDYNNSKSLIKKMMKELVIESSEYRFLPDEKHFNSDFESESYDINYSGSVNKLRNIVEVKPNKYAISKYLAKEIYFSKLYKKNKEETFIEETETLLNFFRGKILIEYFDLWNKVVTFFMINDLKNEINIFVEYIIIAINELETDAKNDIEKNKLKMTLMNYIKHSVEINFALDLSFYKMKDIKEIFEEKNSINIRFSNMFKHNYVFYPLINYTTLLFDKSFSFINRNMPIKKFEILEKSEKRILEFSPRFVKLYEINLLYMNYLMNNNDFLLDNEKNIEKTKKLYFKMNYEGKYEIDRQEMYNKMFTCEVKDFVKNLNYNEICINYNKKMKEIYFSFEEDDWLWFLDDDDEKEKIKSKLEKEEKKLKVAVANMKVKYSDAILSLTEPNISKERLEDLFKILNMAKEEKADMLIFPEMAIPFCWLSFISKFAEENDIAIICGLEYFVDHNKTAYNTLATILPFKIDIYDSALIKLRIKNHYAPQEKLELISKGFKVPLINSYTYDLFKWKNISFACYNCFELTDIVHRSIFKSKIDLIVAAVYNHDTNYFSNIVESTARDLHCYFVLVNSSDLGDTRITMPTKTEEKNLLKIKGGINSVVLTEELSIKELREFQLLEFKEQKKYIKKDISIKEIEKILNEDEDDDALKKLEKIKERIDKYKKNKENKSFKPTPPKFDTDEIKNRG